MLVVFSSEGKISFVFVFSSWSRNEQLDNVNLVCNNYLLNMNNSKHDKMKSSTNKSRLRTTTKCCSFKWNFLRLDMKRKKTNGKMSKPNDNIFSIVRKKNVPKTPIWCRKSSTFFCRFAIYFSPMKITRVNEKQNLTFENLIRSSEQDLGYELEIEPMS